MWLEQKDSQWATKISISLYEWHSYYARLEILKVESKLL